MSDTATHQSTAAPLVAPEWLAEHLDDPNLLILDIRSVVDGGARAAYEAAHIPGAIHTDTPTAAAAMIQATRKPRTLMRGTSGFQVACSP